MQMCMQPPTSMRASSNNVTVVIQLRRTEGCNLVFAALGKKGKLCCSSFKLEYLDSFETSSKHSKSGCKEEAQQEIK